ncbi:hypothetical protein Pfo_010248 [Paulownia fortunei]|nr:hypothetical protein Pfo_010248 [Paulownia fortunei]
MLVFFIFIVFTLFFPVLGVGTDDCMPRRCRKDGPRIQFPFRHKYLHPEYCGYPGFDVYCDQKNETVLVLPFSVNVIAKKINYVSQQVHLYDPEKCLSQKLPQLNLSASPFRFLEKDLSDYDIFNCSASNPCQFYAIDSGSSMDFFPLTSCTKIHEISSVPRNIFQKNDLHLNWSEPACGGCEAQGKRCSLKNSTRGHQIQGNTWLLEQTYVFTHTYTHMRAHTKKKELIFFAAVCVTLGSFLVVITLTALVLLYSSIRIDKENQMKIEKFLEDYRALKPTRFSYSDIRRITLQFSEKLGERGYGIVYKGKLSNEINVAVKVLNNTKGNGEEFVNEVGTIGRIHYVNVVRLVGFCAEGFRRALVYEFLPNDSLEKFIFQAGSKRNSLGWERLQDIALGIAKGIKYLHQGCDQQILHFDIKPHNILLDHNLSRRSEQSAVTMTTARGTMGYIAPEVLSRTFGRVSYKSDVYSIGMLLLEMVGGRKNVDLKVNTSQLGEDFWAHIEEDDDGNIVRRLTIIGLWCIQWYPTNRPSMKVVVQMLEGDADNLTMPPNPFPATNATNSVAGIPERHYQIELPLILE